MMRITPALLASVCIATSCAAAPLEPQPAGPVPRCAIEIEFHVRHTEIDMRTLDRVIAFVESNPAIQRAYDERRAGDEAPTMCLVIPDETSALAVFEKLTILVPPQRAKMPRIKPPPAVVLRFIAGKAASAAGPEP